MNEISLLQSTLKNHFSWHGARVKFLALFIMALLRVKTINLAEIATAFSTQVLVSSNYKRLQRFFREFEIDRKEWVDAICAIMDFQELWVLSLDRTQWQLGKHTYNILTLGIAHQGLAIPIVWEFLPKKGNSQTQERIDIMKKFAQLLGIERVAYLTADREFVGKEWFKYLERNCSFCIRIRHSDLISDGRRNLPGSVVFANLAIGEVRSLSKRRRIWGVSMYVSALKLKSGELLIVVSNRPGTSAIQDYGRRWQIETLFGCLKSRGFELESTHLKEPARLNKMLFLLTLALCWAHRVGVWER